MERSMGLVWTLVLVLPLILVKTLVMALVVLQTLVPELTLLQFLWCVFVWSTVPHIFNVAVTAGLTRSSSLEYGSSREGHFSVRYFSLSSTFTTDSASSKLPATTSIQLCGRYAADYVWPNNWMNYSTQKSSYFQCMFTSCRQSFPAFWKRLINLYWSLIKYK